MSLRTIKCWVVFHLKSRSIMNGFRTKKDLKRHYSAGIPIGCVAVEMKGQYVRPAAHRIPEEKP